jgi:hypothetical protein
MLTEKNMISPDFCPMNGWTNNQPTNTCASPQCIIRINSFSELFERERLVENRFHLTIQFRRHFSTVQRGLSYPPIRDIGAHSSLQQYVRDMHASKDIHQESKHHSTACYQDGVSLHIFQRCAGNLSCRESNARALACTELGDNSLLHESATVANETSMIPRQLYIE